MTDTMSAVAEDLVAKMDGLLSGLITAKLGEGWTPADLAGRLVRTYLPDESYVISLDGMGLIQFYPPKATVGQQDFVDTIKADRAYRLLL